MEGLEGLCRGEEGIVEVRAALALSANGHVRSAAGKAFQALESYLAALAAERERS
ncbi:MAG: PaREP1 family protein [Thermoproteus sp. AZ2]|uniref:PaREP1 family protein n=1 Tax=Thermoproteus sp. AZ2 TaxID=1609232 RepID=A0ACC6V226_9CREN